jgi:hypothetical protein
VDIGVGAEVVEGWVEGGAVGLQSLHKRTRFKQHGAEGGGEEGGGAEVEGGAGAEDREWLRSRSGKRPRQGKGTRQRKGTRWSRMHKTQGH